MSLVFSQLPEEPLTKEQAAACVASGDLSFMVTHSLREALIYLRDLSRGKVSDGDLISIAYKALERSARSFSPARGHRFFYFAKKALRGALVEHWRTLDTVKHGAPAMGLDEADKWLKAGLNRHPDLEDPDTTSALEGHTEPDFSSIERAERLEGIKQAMTCLSKFERAVVLFVQHTDFTFQECADEFGCSRAWVSLCWHRAVDKLRAALRAKGRL